MAVGPYNPLQRTGHALSGFSGFNGLPACAMSFGGKGHSLTMTDRDQITESDHLLEAKRQVAVHVVERLLATCQKYERPIWLSRYIEVLDCLRQGRLQHAIFAECRLKNDSGQDYGEPEWVLSREIGEDVTKAVSSIRISVHYGDKQDPLSINCEPADVKSKGTVEQERHAMRERVKALFQRDPIDRDPRFAGILAEVEKETEEVLKDHPMKSGMGLGFCHIYWAVKKSILKERYGIEWKTPAELNPETTFD